MKIYSCTKYNTQKYYQNKDINTPNFACAKIKKQLPKLIQPQQTGIEVTKKILEATSSVATATSLFSQIIISGKNTTSDKTTPNIDALINQQVKITPLNKISDEEFENIIKNTESNSQKIFAMKILSDERLYNNKSVMYNFTYLLKDVQIHFDEDFIQKKMDIIDILLSSKAYNETKDIKNTLGLLIHTTLPSRAEYLKLLVNDNEIINCIKEHEDEKQNLFSHLINAICFGEDNSNQEIYNKAKKYAREGIRLKDQLKSVANEINNFDIYSTFIPLRVELNQIEQICGKDTILAAFALKLDGLKDFLKDIYELCKNLPIESYEKLILKFNPKESYSALKLKNEISILKKEYGTTKSQDKNALKTLEDEINTKTHELRTIIKAKIPLSPQQKINKLYALHGLSEIRGINIEKFIDLVKEDSPENIAEWNKQINKEIFKKLDMEYDEQLSYRVDLATNRFLDNIMRSGSYFCKNLKELFEILQNNPDKSIKKTLNTLPHNIETRKQFEEMGLDYDKWVESDKNSFITLKLMLNTEKSCQNAIRNVEADFNDIAYLNLPQEQKDILNKILGKEEIHLKEIPQIIYNENGINIGERSILKLFEGDTPISFEKLSKVISTLKEGMNTKDFWTKEHDNQELNNYVKTFYNHIIKLRNAEIKNAQFRRSNRDTNIKIRKTDMNDIKHSLFLGNHASCCTAVGSGRNEFSAPTYIMTKAISAIEIIDSKDVIGNSMCYIAEVDGIPSLVLDNIEIKIKYQYNDKIRDAFMEYAKKLTKEIGAEDMPIYAGPYRHKFNMDIYPLAKHSVKIKGSSGKNEVYIDYVTMGYKINNIRVDTVKLYKIR